MRPFEQDVRTILESLDVVRPTTKDEVRRTLQQRKAEELVEHRPQLRRVERQALDLMRRVNYSRILPTFRFARTADERLLWAYFRRIISSAPFTTRPGRAVFGFCVDQHTGGVAGVIDVGSDVSALGPREKHIGWSKDRKWAGLSHLMNVGTCICTHPFGLLTGGKFQIAACMSDQIADLWLKRYGVIAAGVTTTSLYGRSSVYNRVPGLLYLGDTPGQGIAHVPADAWGPIRDFMLANNVIARIGGLHNFPGSKGSRLDSLIRVCHELKVPMDRVSSKQPRGVYFAPLGGEDAYQFLRGETATFRPTVRRFDEVRSWWLDRWYAMRWPKVQTEVEGFDWRTYTVDAQIDLCQRGRSADSGTAGPPARDGANPIHPLQLQAAV